MIPRSHLITLNQVMIDILKTTNSPIVRVVCNVGLTVRTQSDSELDALPVPKRGDHFIDPRIA